MLRWHAFLLPALGGAVADGVQGGERMGWGRQEIERFRRALREGLQQLELDLTDMTVEIMVEYAITLASAQEEQNLTALREPEQVAWKHFVDSLMGWKVFRQWEEDKQVPRNQPGGQCQAESERWLADLGAGAGFPGVVWAIVGDWHCLEIEAEGRKAEFIEGLRGLVGPGRLQVWHGRAEEAGRQEEWRERFDVVVARALARLDVVAEYGLPLLRLGGGLVAYKGPEGPDEVQWVGPEVRGRLGGGEAKVFRCGLPGDWGRRSIVILEKVGHCEELYPRRVGIPEKRPLGGSRRRTGGGEGK
ncbi:MAG: 16S rRNA (guanine(527)-N(7))-methyltransferase RsmG [Limnochordaceae bacterium]|nr:16S rRNA (guanine(527)-N(7))-methyltransferase RsmG [Limnochordaceae bacterium]